MVEIKSKLPWHGMAWHGMAWRGMAVQYVAAIQTCP